MEPELTFKAQSILYHQFLSRTTVSSSIAIVLCGSLLLVLGSRPLRMTLGEYRRMVMGEEHKQTVSLEVWGLILRKGSDSYHNGILEFSSLFTM